MANWDDSWCDVSDSDVKETQDQPGHEEELPMWDSWDDLDSDAGSGVEAAAQPEPTTPCLVTRVKRGRPPGTCGSAAWRATMCLSEIAQLVPTICDPQNC